MDFGNASRPHCLSKTANCISLTKYACRAVKNMINVIFQKQSCPQSPHRKSKRNTGTPKSVPEHQNKNIKSEPPETYQGYDSYTPPSICRPVERSSDRAIARSSDRAIDSSRDRATERLSDRGIERSSDPVIERSSDSAIERGSGQERTIEV